MPTLHATPFVAILLSAALFALSTSMQAQSPGRVSSPDSRNVVTVDVRDGALRRGQRETGETC